MKKLAVRATAIVSFFFFAPAMADEARKGCEAVSTLAETIMKDRQRGVPISEELAYWEDVSSQDPKGKSSEMVKKLRTQLVLSAYKRTQASREQQQFEAVKSFKENAFIECMQLTISK